MSLFSSNVGYSENDGYMAEKRGKTLRACKLYYSAMLSFDYADEPYHMISEYHQACRGYDRCYKRLNLFQRFILWCWEKRTERGFKKLSDEGWH